MTSLLSKTECAVEHISYDHNVAFSVSQKTDEKVQVIILTRGAVSKMYVNVYPYTDPETGKHITKIMPCYASMKAYDQRTLFDAAFGIKNALEELYHMRVV